MRYIVVAFIVIVFIFLGILLFGGHSGKPATPITSKPLASFANSDVDMRLTIDGEINGDDAHRQIVMTITRSQRTLQINQGYQGTVLKSEKFSNNVDAYKAFLSALDVGGFTNTRVSKFANEQGQCPLGQRFIYETLNNDHKNLRTWSTSCSSSGGTFKGQATLIQNLFENQFANYNDYISDLQY